MHATDAKTQKIEPDPNFLWQTKVNVMTQREVVFIFQRAKISDENFEVGRDLYYYKSYNYTLFNTLLVHNAHFLILSLKCVLMSLLKRIEWSLNNGL